MEEDGYLEPRDSQAFKAVPYDPDREGKWMPTESVECIRDTFLETGAYGVMLYNGANERVTTRKGQCVQVPVPGHGQKESYW